MLNILRLLRPHILKLFISVCCVLVQIWSMLAIPNILSNIVNIGITQGNVDYILKSGLSMLLVSFLGSMATFLNCYIAAVVSSTVSRTLRERIFEKATRISVADFDNVGASSLITRTTNDITQIQTFIVMFLRVVLMAPFMLVGAVTMAVSKNMSMSLVILLTAPFLILTMSFIAKKGFFLFKDVQKKVDNINLISREKLIGIRVIRVFNKDKFEHERFDRNNVDLTKLSIHVNRIVMLAQPALMLILNVAVVGVIYVGAKQIDIGQLSVGDLMAVVQYIIQILMAVMLFAMMFVIFPRTFVSVNRIFEVLNIKDVVEDVDEKQVVQKGIIEFKNVNFKFNGANENVLSNISFTAKTGEVTAIIGSTGSGKSTVVKLLTGIYDISDGDILIDGKNINTYSRENLRNAISYVSQKAILFSGTIEDTLKFGNESATKEKLEQVLKISASYDFVMDKKEKLEANVAQGGTNFSGGQKQRLSIARALAKDSNIYIFDDSFSALDYKTDLKVRKALKEITEEKTVIIVAQRVATVKDANNIIVLDEGRVVSQGTHSFLVNNCEIYKEIVLSQDVKEV